MDKSRTSKVRRPLSGDGEQTGIMRQSRLSPVQTVNNPTSAITTSGDKHPPTSPQIVNVPGAYPSVHYQQQSQPDSTYSRPRAFSADSPYLSPSTEPSLPFGQQPVSEHRGLAAMHAALGHIGSNRSANSYSKSQQRRISSSPLGITRDNTLHQQLLLVGAPSPTRAANIVTRLPVEEDRMPGAYVTANANTGKTQGQHYQETYIPAGKERDGGTLFPKEPRVEENPQTSGNTMHRSNSASRPKNISRSHSHRTKLTQRAAPTALRLSRPLDVTDGFTFKAQMSAKEEPRKQEQQKPNATDRAPDISNRPIALPKLRLNKLRPANRQMPTSKEIAMNDALFTVNGKPQARRPDYFVFEDEPLGIEDPGIDISTSYIDDTGFDLVDAELGSDFGKSFDLDMLPDAPARRLSDYNIGVVDVVPRTMSPEDVKCNYELVGGKPPSEIKRNQMDNDKAIASPSKPSQQQQQQQRPLSADSHGMSVISIQSSSYKSTTDEVPEFPASPPPLAGLAAQATSASTPHRTLGLVSNDNGFAMPVITEENANFYIKMLALRSAMPAEDLSPKASPRQKTEERPRSIRTMGDHPSEAVQPNQEQTEQQHQRQKQRNSELLASPHLSNFWPANASTFQSTAQPQIKLPDNTHRRLEIQAECPRIFHTPTSFASRARGFFRGRPKSKSTAGHTRNASDGRHTEQQPPARVATSTNTFATTVQRRRQTMPSQDVTLPYTHDHTLRKRAATMKQAHKQEVSTGFTNVSGADSSPAHVLRRHTMHISTGIRHPQVHNKTGSVLQVKNCGQSSCEEAPLTQTLLQMNNRAVCGNENANKSRSSGAVTGQFPLAVNKESGNDASQLPGARLSSSLGDNVCDCCALAKEHFGCKRNSCFPTGCLPKAQCTEKHRVPKDAAMPDPNDAIQPATQFLPTTPPTSPTRSIRSSLSESWSHIYRTRNAGKPVVRKREKVRDTCVYPFKLSYNCILLCFTPCIGLAQEYKAACTCC